MDLHDLTAGYALDALDPDERARYEEHLASCETCRAELQEFWQVAGALGRAAARRRPRRFATGSANKPGTSVRT